MSYVDRLKKTSVTVNGESFAACACKFRGAQFFVKDNSQEGISRVVQTFKVPNSNSWINEDCGGSVPSLSMDIFLFGEDCDAQKDVLLDACGKEGYGELEHPWLGKFQAICTGLNLSFGTSRLGYIRGKISFKTESDVRSGFEFLSASKRSAVKVGSKNFIYKIQEKFSQSFSVAGKSYSTFNNVVNRTSLMLDDILSCRKILAGVNEFANRLGQIKANLETSIKVPAGFSRDLSEIITSTLEMFGIDGKSKEECLEYMEFIENGPEYPNDPGGIFESIKLQMQKLAAVMLASLIVDAKFLSVEECRDYMDRFNDIFDSLTYGIIDVDEIVSLNEIHDSAMGYLRDTMANMATVVDKEILNTTNVISLCYEVYGSIDRIDEIMERNSMRQGLFVMPGKVKVLSK